MVKPLFLTLQLPLIVLPKMLNNIYLTVGIIFTLFSLTGMTITSFLWLNKSFREHLEELLKRHDKDNRAWTKQLFLNYFLALDERIKDVNLRLKQIEKKCEKQHDQ